MPGLVHRPRPEARIEQVENRVLDSADVLVDREPAVDRRGSGGCVLIPGIGEAREIPRGIPEGVHGIGLASRRLATGRAGAVFPRRVMVERVARPVEGHIIRQLYRQVLFRHRNDTAALAMDDRDRAPPVALARDSPVPQPEIDLADSNGGAVQQRSSQAAGDLGEGSLGRHAIEVSGN